MKAIVRDRYGSADVLELKDIETPAPADDEVLVRIRASSVNSGDLDYMYGRPAMARLGTGLREPKNRGLGLDIAGTVEAVGRDVTRFGVGDEVFGDLTEHGYGAFAEYAVVPAEALAPKPPSLSFEEAATVPQSAILALQGLRSRKPLRPGQKVLVNGASGNVGPFAVQIAKAHGAEVTGVCSTDKMDFVRSLGADHVIDYRREDYAESGQRYDRILDVASHRSIFASVHALRPGGVYAWTGGSTASLFQALVLGPLISLVGSRKAGLFMWKPFKQADVADLTGLIEEGKIQPVIDRRYALDEVPAALRYLDEGRARGKLVITP